MNSESYVPIKTIANFKMIRNLTSDLELLTNVMKECPSVHVDETHTLIKPNFKPHKNIIILREIPSATPVEVSVPQVIFYRTRRFLTIS
jgi:la-related protein 4